MPFSPDTGFQPTNSAVLFMGTGAATITFVGANRLINLHVYANGSDVAVTFTYVPGFQPPGGIGLTFNVRNGTGFDWTPGSTQRFTQIQIGQNGDYFIEQS